MSESIVTEYRGICFFCGRQAEGEYHLIFGTAGREMSEKDGLKVPICSNCHNMDQEQKGEYEYATFLWSRSRGRYKQVNRAVQTEQLCRNRLQEYISKGWLNEDYDTSKVVFKRRTITMFVSEWEELN